MVEAFLDDAEIFDARDAPQRPTAGRAGLDIDPEQLFEALRASQPGRGGCELIATVRPASRRQVFLVDVAIDRTTPFQFPGILFGYLNYRPTRQVFLHAELNSDGTVCLQGEVAAIGIVSPRDSAEFFGGFRQTSVGLLIRLHGSFEFRGFGQRILNASHEVLRVEHRYGDDEQE